MTHFGVRLGDAMDHWSPLCVGIDPHDALLAAWGLPVSVDGLRAFADTCVEAFAGRVAAVKPQAAFFERFGSAGVAVLESVLADLRQAGTLTVLDVKRGDIGTTMTAYAQAHLVDDAPGAADAITLSPYLGFGSLAPAIELARAGDRGVFVLALTSNPEGAEVQHARTTTGSVAGTIIEHAREANSAYDAALGPVGLVVGATVGNDIADLGLAEALAASRAPLLAPGIGAQGATVDDIRRGFGAATRQVLATTSRGVLQHGPSVAALCAELERQQQDAAALRQ